MTGVALSTGTIVQSQPQKEDREYVSNSLVYGVDYTIDTTTKRIDVLSAATGQEVYSAVYDSYIARDSNTANTPFEVAMD